MVIPGRTKTFINCEVQCSTRYKMEKVIIVSIKISKQNVGEIDALASIKTAENPDGVKVTRSHLIRRWISEGLKREAVIKRDLNNGNG